MKSFPLTNEEITALDAAPIMLCCDLELPVDDDVHTAILESDIVLSCNRHGSVHAGQYINRLAVKTAHESLCDALASVPMVRK